MRGQRNKYLDIIKAFACIFVVYFHSSNLFGYAGISNLVSALSMLARCGVPIFFVISGYLSKSLTDEPYFEMIKKKLKSLVAPFVVWNLFYLFLEIIGHYIMPVAFENMTWNLKEIIVDVFGIPFIRPPMYEPLWFVRELFICFLICPMITFGMRYLPVPILCFLSTVVWIVNIPYLYDNGYYLKSSIPFFALGLFFGIRLNNEGKEMLAKICTRKDAVVGTLLIAVASAYIRHLCGDNIVASFFRYAAILFFFPAIFGFAKYVEKGSGSLMKMFLTVSKYSFMVFVLHGKLLSVIQIICTRVIPQNILILLAEYIVMPIAVIAIIIFVSKIFSKRVPRLYLFLTGGR